MGRLYLIVILLLGMASAVIGHLPSKSRAPSRADLEQRARESGVQVVDFSGGSGTSGSSNSTSDGSIEIERSPDGHFYADVEINGATVHALIDTGASGIALSRDDARSAGVATSIGMPEVVGTGADGAVHGEYVTLDRITLGPRTAEKMEAVVLNSGELTLLGQEFLSRFDSVEIHGDVMVLR
ncbi:MAG TPA: TIGR02281 family clan AA aspartic protease [Sphingomicrobium sp.]